MDYEVKKVEVYRVNGKDFDSQDEANKHIAFMKNDKILKLANSTRKNRVSGVLKEMLEQGLHNKNKILSVIKHLEKHDC